MKKHKTCKYAKGSGDVAVYVTPGCPRSNMIRGVLVTSKKRCRECKSWKGKDKNE